MVHWYFSLHSYLADFSICVTFYIRLSYLASQHNFSVSMRLMSQVCSSGTHLSSVPSFPFVPEALIPSSVALFDHFFLKYAWLLPLTYYHFMMLQARGIHSVVQYS